jgi:Tol biopolymer transport system component
MKIPYSLLKKDSVKVLLFILLIYSLNNYAQNKFSIEKVMSSGFYSNLVVSKDNNFVAWVENKKGVRNVFISDGNSSKKVTDYNLDDGQTISNLIIGSDQAYILFVRGGAPNRNGEIPNPLSLPNKTKRAIWKVNLKNNKLSLISEGFSPSLANDGQKLAFIKKGEVWHTSLTSNDKPKPLFTLRGRVSNLNWSPDSEKLAFVSGRSDHSFIGIFEQQTKTISYLSPSVDYDSEPVWSNDSKQLAFIRIPREKQVLPFMPRRSALPWSIFVAQVDNKKAHQIWKAPNGQGSAFRSISADKQLFWAANKRLIFPWEGDGFTNMYSINTDGTDLKMISPGLSEIQFASLSNNGDEFVYSSNSGDVDRQHIWKYSVLTGVNKQVTKGEGIEWSPVITKKGKLFMLASGAEHSSFPAILVNNKLQSLQKPSDLNEFPKNSLVKPKQVIFSAADGMKIHGQLFLPKNMKKGEKHPALLFFHGGSRRQMLLGFHH